MGERDFMAKPCKLCPFKRGLQVFGSVSRAEDFAYMAENPYTYFHCHKTGDVDEDGDGDFIPNAKSLECAGLLSMKVHSGTIECPDGFHPSEAVYADFTEMIDAYETWCGEEEVD